VTTPLTVYTLTANSTTLATAKTLATALGGTQAGTATTQLGTATGYGEVYSQIHNPAWPALGAVAAPDGGGYILDSTILEGQTIPAGPWTPTFRVLLGAGTATGDLIVVAYKYNINTLSYTLIGICTFAGQSLTTGANFTWGATILPAASFGVGDRLYFETWTNITVSDATGTTIRWAQSSNATLGVATDQVITPGFDATPAVGVPRFIPRALGATIIPTIVSQPLPYVERALGSTLIYENRVFIPRALGGDYIPDASLWVPRALGGTIQVVPLAGTLAGVGTFAGTLSLATALSSTLAGVGTLTGTLSANTALAVTFVGTGTLTGTLSLTTALSVTLAGVGTLSGTLSANTALTDTLVGVGTLTGMLSLTTALASTLVGVGTLSGTFSLRVALSLTFAGVGTLGGTLSIPGVISLFLSATWVTRDMAGTWRTRDLAGTWKMRDEQGTWDSRDDKATWDTRDDQATWKSR